MLGKLFRKAKETAKCVHQLCYDFCYDLLEDEPPQTEQAQTEQPKKAASITIPVKSTSSSQQIPVNIVDERQVISRPAPKPSIMRGYLCASFEDETSLGMAAVVIAIDEHHARQLLSQELKKHGLRLEVDDKLIEIDLHTPSVILESNNISPNQFPDYSGW